MPSDPILFALDTNTNFMGMRKKIRTKWKAQRKVDEAKRRKAKAIRHVKAAEAEKTAK